MTTWTGPDGLKVNFNRKSAEQASSGNTEQAVVRSMVLKYDSQDPKNIETAGNTDGREAAIPANAIITGAYTRVDTAFTSGGSTTLTIGLALEDGTPVDADGIDATVAKTAIDAVGDVVVNDGALVGGLVTTGTAESFPYVTVGTGPWTAGVATIVINYIVV